MVLIHTHCATLVNKELIRIMLQSALQGYVTSLVSRQKKLCTLFIECVEFMVRFSLKNLSCNMKYKMLEARQ